jgi:diguanylate cyclase (GGDEF)-like protein
MINSISYSILPLIFIGGLIADSHSMAYKDQLTGIKSRRALEQAATGLGSQYVVVMCDVDHFKKFNDTYGHDVGDQVLKLVAKLLDDVEGGGKAFRYGGEEFTLLFSGKQADQVTAYVEKVRQSIASYKIMLRDQNREKQSKKNRTDKKAGKTVSVTMSFGISELSQKAKTFEDVIKEADKALYKSKKAGRNCVSLAT